MKSTTSCSERPAAICSRIWLRRSTASGAFESASVWFWHTRQRSSCARFITRRSSASSAWASAAKQRRTAATLLRTVELLDERLDLLLHHVGGERADLLVADHSLAVDHIGLGHAVDAVVDADAPVRVENDQLIGVAIALQPRQRILALVFVVQADHRYEPGLRDARPHRMLDEARRAPRGPHVQSPPFPRHVLLREALVGLAQERQLERRRRLADEWRRHLARIELQADGEQRNQRDEDAERPRCLPHAVASTVWRRAAADTR